MRLQVPILVGFRPIVPAIRQRIPTSEALKNSSDEKQRIIFLSGKIRREAKLGGFSSCANAVF
jgi:hypothetical protein